MPYLFKSRYERPFEHQVVTTKFLLQNKRAYVLNEMGTGKTLSVLWGLDILLQYKKIKKVLIVCPLSTIYAVWANEIFLSFTHLSYTILHGSRQRRLDRLNEDHSIYLINFDGLTVIEKELKKKEFDIFVFDELTAFKNNKSQRSKAAQRITKDALSVWGMTGAPTANSVLDAFGQAKLVNPASKYLPKYYGQFRDLLCLKLDDYTWIPKEDAVDAVFAIMQPAIRYKLRECVSIPPTLTQYRQAPLDAKTAKIYKEVEKEYISYMDEGVITAVNAGAHYNKLLQISSGVARDEAGTWHRLSISSKIKVLEEIYNELENKKIVVGIFFREAIQFALEELRSKGYKADFIDSSVNARARADKIAKFDHGDLEFLLCQPATLAYGVDLTVSNTSVWFSPISSNEQFTQFTQRIVRASQKLVQNIIMIYSSAKERKVYQALKRKESLSQALLEMYAHE